MSANLRRKGSHPPTTVGVRKLSCGIKVSAVHCLILSQNVTKHACDRQTDGRAEL